MLVQKMRVGIPSGIHFRPAEKLAETAMEYEAKITLRNQNGDFNMKSFLSVLAANVRTGEEVEIICEGSDEKEALEQIIRILQNRQNT